MMSGLFLSRRLLDYSSPQLVEPPKGSNGGDPREESYTGSAAFDNNMVIILAALLCALILGLGLNWIVGRALRCWRRFRPETPEQEEARLAMTGLKKRALRKIPMAVYGSSTEDEEFSATECSICLGEFVDGEKVRVLPKCNHRFHVRCIDVWLTSHSSCPNCRHSLLEPLKCPPAPPPGNRSSPDHVVVLVGI